MHIRHYAEEITKHSNTPPLRGATTIMWNRGHIHNTNNFESRIIQRPNRRLTPRSRSIYTHIKILHAKLSNDISNPTCRNLS
uniref:Uncharacterized protein n=1 Tax=Candidatus Kentrum sp. TC TaxID=2126339 RepID=A0A451A5P6_9GAMM|nr:MAG: hypothetical protein BECKTC1821E_GA0114239_105925 [Candidatus Kentron sp. TC]VFK48102.1 MAG: hypothetical protein BECKTC1821D_GA0114238_105724 [Candidatus Kentron sp. TC]VFK61365.1 MAG: hypothetical protein BECKTC1821F_GA0114240_105725 [Candidatus Kentron sp. TC]